MSKYEILLINPPIVICVCINSIVGRTLCSTKIFVITVHLNLLYLAEELFQRDKIKINDVKCITFATIRKLEK